MTKILCIDDTPDEKLLPGQTLQDIVNNILKGTSFKAIFKRTGKEGIEAASNDTEVKLILLDVEFNRRIEGSRIADELRKKAPDIKIIVLTRFDDKGKKISFGWKPNVVHYVLKREITKPNIQDKLRNICKAVIEDFSNKNWILKYEDTSDAIILSNTKTGRSYGIDIPLTSKPALLRCMQNPNCPVDVTTDQFGKNLNKVHNSINKNVLEGTDWNTWGILTKEGCAKGQLKLVIGSVASVSSTSKPEDPYVLQSQFNKFKKDIESRLDTIEQALNRKKP